MLQGGEIRGNSRNSKGHENGGVRGQCSQSRFHWWNSFFGAGSLPTTEISASIYSTTGVFPLPRGGSWTPYGTSTVVKKTHYFALE